MDERRIPDAAALDAAFAAPRFLLLKHSLACPVSARAFREVQAVLAAHPDLEAGWIDVVEQRPLSLAVAERTGVAHESPQAFLLEDGRVIWDASHFGISQRRLEKTLAKA